MIGAGLAGLLAFAATLTPHLGPPVWAELTVEDDRLTFTLSGEPEALDQLLGGAPSLVGPLSPEGAREVEAAFEALFERESPLLVGGEPLSGRLDGVEVPTEDTDSGGWLILHARWVAPLARPPGSVGIRWSAFEGAVWQSETFIPLTVIRGRRVSAQGFLQPTEPEFVWHPDPEDRTPRARPLVTRVAERPETTWRVPLPSVVIALAALGLFVVGARRERARKGLTALAAGALFVAALARDVGVVELRSPLEPVVARPGDREALAIFETLHRNVYDAFAATTEEEIYDLLAVSVTPELLEPLYFEIYESLILREQGGAVCAIEGVERLDGELLPEAEATSGAARFSVRWSWQVHGLVDHWGHEHRRRNEYRAVYTVAHDGEAWKIAAIEVEEHRRIDLPDEVPTPATSGAAAPDAEDS